MVTEFKFGNLRGIQEDYDRDGVVIIREAFDEDFVQELDRHIDWLIERHPELSPERLHHRLVPKDPFWVRFVSDDRLLDVAESLVGPNIAFFAADYICKRPREGGSLSWHQDAYYWAPDPMEVITVWFAVSESNRENGGVQVVPGSHRIGPQSPGAEGIVVHGINSEVTEDLFDVGDPVYLELNPGDISVHHPYTLHGSAPNTSDHWRRGGSIQYMPTTTRITKEWPSAFLFRGEAAEGVNNDYQPKPRYIGGEHMPFKGAEAWV